MKQQSTIRDLIAAQNRRLQSDDLRTRVSISVGDWVVSANVCLQNAPPPLPQLKLRIKRRSRICDYPFLHFTQAFGEQQPETNGSIRLDTVHGAKGQSIEAVLLVLKTKPPSGKAYKKLILENTVRDSEELRIVYVAVTRAKKVLRIAVPMSDKSAWTEFLGLE